MVKTWSSAGILFVALLVSAFILQQAQLASANSFNDDPVPGGMCGCMSCNCFLSVAPIASISKEEVVSGIDNASQGASIVTAGASATGAAATPKTTTTPSAASAGTKATGAAATTKTTTTTATPAKTTTTAAPKTTTPSAASAGSGGASSAATKTTAAPSSQDNVSYNPSSDGSSGESRKTTPSNPNTSAASAGASGASSAAKPANPNTSTPAKNSSGSPDDRQEKNDAAKKATGRANDSYLYSSDITNTAPNLTAPRVDKSSYSPQTDTPGKNNTFTPPTPANTTPGSVTEIQYTYGQAVLEARKNTNDSGAKYEYRTPSGEVRYVDSNGHPLLSPEPATTKTESSAASKRKYYAKPVVRTYENPETALRDAKAFKNDDNTYYGFPADPTDKNNKRYHYFDSNGDYVLEL